MITKKCTVTAKDIKEALKQRYFQPEYELMFEVEGDHGRRADAIAMCMWPSRRNHIFGFEIKISKSDLKRELNKCAKAESCENHCNYWMLVVPDGIIDDKMIIPENWGIILFKSGKLKILRKPAYKEAHMTAFWAAMLLRAKWREDNTEREQMIQAALTDRIEEIRNRERENLKSKFNREDRDYFKFVEIKDILNKNNYSFLRIGDAKEIADNLIFAMNNRDFLGKYGSLQRLKVNIKHLGDEIDEIITSAERLKENEINTNEALISEGCDI